ncbi:MAG TPA: 3-dehydroquinate synthase [Phycisphaerae bacterium]|nr:3-dehydroquinate synthase [Phycisphaerae bacterium]HRW53595.1 3-dehydroquinate synthase [Phycisphaerae bacterium]
MSDNCTIVNVDLGSRSYDIHIGAGLLDTLGQKIRNVSAAKQITIVTDRNVAQHYSIRAVTSVEAAGFAAKTITIPPGESSKSLAMAQRLYDGLAERKRGRLDPIVALGGGVVGDLAGFVAATWMRGAPFIQCPTTTESMIDAGVGGKTAVNHESGKNLIGAFHQPLAVVMDIETAHTLEDRDFRAGLAESVKHALIADGEFLAWHEAHAAALLARDPVLLAELVARNCRIKAGVVQADERETEAIQVGRAALNFGHTVGHALETLSQGRLRHGEAVSLGMLAALRLSSQFTGLAPETKDRVAALLNSMQLPTSSEDSYDASSVIDVMGRDKKVVDQRPRFVLLEDIGRPVWNTTATDTDVQAAINELIGPRPTA